ncbi:pyridoxine 5'-phosphate synthase [Vibrio chagasii]|nr:pyridoxine 5'-phosphate synthase [Vibrio chagasii]
MLTASRSTQQKHVAQSFIELHTGHYVDAKTEEDQQDELKKIAAGASYADDLGITVNAGHGLTYQRSTNWWRFQKSMS